MNKKLTDAEIVKIKKRLKDIVEENEFEYFHSNNMGWYAEIRLAYMAIKHLQAENERLKDLCADCSMLKGKIETISDLQEQIEYWQRGYNDLRQELKTAKAEAYKEFAENAVKRVEKAKLKYQKLCKEQGEEMEEHMHIHFNGIIGIINNLLKEKVGENNETKTF